MAQYYLTERDRGLLRRLERLLDGRENLPSPRLPVDPEDETPQAPETYIALVPTGGIPAATPAMGTGLDFEKGDQPGVALCDIYQPVGNPLSPSLEPIGKQQPVLNLSSSSISQQWITICREKFGRWIAQVGGGGTDCDPRNEQWQIYMIGEASGGTFTLTFEVNNTSDTITLDYDSTAAEAETAFATHSEISASDVEATGGPLPSSSIGIEFIGNLAETQLVLPSSNKSGLSNSVGTGTTGDVDGLGIVVTRWQPGFGG